MIVTCMFEKSFELLENLFSFWCDGVTEKRANDKRTEAFYSFFNTYPELLSYADYRIGDNGYTIEFYFDEKDYTKSKDEFESLVKAFGCFDIIVDKD